MKLHRINAIMLHYWYSSKRSLPRMMDILYWPTVELILWGFISVFLEKMELNTPNAVSFLLGATILWTIFRRSQQDVNLAFLEDIWYRNVVNLFVSPLKISEYLVGGIAVAFIKMIFVTIYMAVLAALFYHFNVFTLGFSLIPFIAVLLLFGWVMGIFISGIIFRFGTDSQIIAFSFAFLLQPISAVFYPLSVLPVFVQRIALLLPTTHIFEGMRFVLTTHTFPLGHFLWGAVLSLVYLFLSCLFFAWMFRKVRELGLISKVE